MACRYPVKVQLTGDRRYVELCADWVDGDLA